MNLITWDQFFPYVQPEVPSCPSQLVRNALRDAAIEFCKFTQIWEEDCVPQVTAANIQEYQVIPEESATYIEPFELTSVFVNDVRVDPATKAYLDQTYPTWQTDKADTQVLYTQTDYRSILLVYTPSVSGRSIRMRAILRPKRSSTSTGQRLLDDFYSPITKRAKEQLMVMAGKSWANPLRAAGLHKEWMKERADFFWQAQRNRTGAELQVSPATKFGRR